ncbi:hypothetical protein F4778DRAFT_718537 [Xylariomycetidae sp. FL2044]|nr:hypothetical protein F4778DRAFT_718537 [Xylariomycetidae sp. FL2044]
MGDDNPWLLDALQGILPEQYHAHLAYLEPHLAHLATPLSILHTIRQQLSSLLSQIHVVLYPLAAPLLSRAVSALYEAPDLVVLGFLLMLFVLALQAVMFVHRTMLYVTRLAFRMVFWAAVVAGLAVVWQRGPEKTARDVVVVVSKLAGFAAVIKDIWLSEYRKYDAQGRGSGGSSAAGRGAGSRSSGRRGGR